MLATESGPAAPTGKTADDGQRADLYAYQYPTTGPVPSWQVHDFVADCPSTCTPVSGPKASPQAGQMFDPAVELESVHRAFVDRAGPYFNGYAGCSQERWLGTVARVRADNQAVPDFSLSYPGLALRPAAEWPALDREVNDGLRQLAEALREGWDEMPAERRVNGTHAQFCGE